MIAYERFPNDVSLWLSMSTRINGKRQDCNFKLQFLSLENSIHTSSHSFHYSQHLFFYLYPEWQINWDLVLKCWIAKDITWCGKKKQNKKTKQTKPIKHHIFVRNIIAVGNGGMCATYCYIVNPFFVWSKQVCTDLGEIHCIRLLTSWANPW